VTGRGRNERGAVSVPESKVGTQVGKTGRGGTNGDSFLAVLKRKKKKEEVGEAR